ncbi:hypothetical protein [Spongiibacter pelagi]|nr:hypothetical protein [Spongiibacter pelagi]|tara:strand:+ start:343 stop:474 length:132 start_codon:yes stop_codon:yes gene_type:complete
MWRTKQVAVLTDEIIGITSDICESCLEHYLGKFLRIQQQGVRA